VGDVCRDILRPLLDGVEGYDPDRVFVLALEQIEDDRSQIGGLDGGFPVDPAIAAKIIDHEIHIDRRPSVQLRASSLF
jgi:hypothetical protein